MKTTRRSSIAWLLPLALVVSGLVTTPRTDAQGAFPTKPVTIWVGFPPGGGTDILTRALANGAEKLLGQKIVVVNKPGATGAVATAEVVKARADGYTLVATTDTPVTRSPHLRDVDYDPFRDLTYIVRLGRYKLGVVVRENSPYKTWREAVEWAKKNPGQLTFGHPGIGSTPQLVMARIAAKEGIVVRSVPFGGDAPALSALLGGHIVMSGNSSVSIAGYVQAKRLRVLLVNDKEGLEYAPDAISFETAGYDLESSTSVIVVAPSGVPAAVAARLEQAFVEAATTEPFVSVARKNELIVGDRLTGAALREYLRTVSANYEALIKEAGLYKSEKK